MKAEKIKDNIKQVYDDIAEEFSASRAYPWEELQVFIPYLRDDFKVLDLGCGNGRLLKSFDKIDKKFNYLGVDFSKELIRKAKEDFPDHKFLSADMTEVNFNPDSFDMVCMIASFHHLPTKMERLDLLFKIHRWLRPGGYLFMTNWNLWQKKYLQYAMKNFWHKKSWNDFFIPWTTYEGSKAWRYYHSFTDKELTHLLQTAHFELKPEGVYKTKFNINCLVRKSKDEFI